MVGRPKVIGEGEVRVKIKISDRAQAGKRDVTVTDGSGDSGTLPGAFEVLSPNQALQQTAAP
jgi:hypothetical protein